MKKMLFITILSALSTSAFAAPTFDHRGIQKGAISENCYHDPCSIAKVMKFELIENQPGYHLIKLNVVGGRQAWGSKKIVWNHNSHNLFITCSLSSPTVQNGDQITTLPINTDMAMPGVLYGDGILYAQACHNFDGDTVKLAKKYGYNVSDW
ncbi:hypothetical protein [Psychrobacter sp. UBA3962]|uniref:hypothetical protein n=1 Tax=Psychrobacter sp. UBA3962 TaxID=1947352 RepID=UPI0025D52DCE|nr:hypothetical protein [Psychrobacter sp. UBA3962]